MPEMNGLQATSNIRALNHGSNYTIILLSGIEEMNDEDVKKNGFNGFLKKPLSKKVFEDLVGSYKK